jgi:RNA polymerase sigma-70 factor (ECF subfamily)
MALSGKYVIRSVAFSSGNKSRDKGADSQTQRIDQHLIIAARSGCKAAFNDLWDLYSRRVYRTILGITKNHQDAEDALQDSFLSAFLALETFEGRSSFYSWVTRIAINSALGILRKRRCRPEGSLTLPSLQDEECALESLRDFSPNPEQIYEQQQRHAKLIEAIHRLPVSLREAVETRIADDCSVKEMAHRLNITQAAAKSRLYRASTRLGSLVAKNYEARAVRT